MDIIIHIYMFTIGAVLGSFYTLAIYRIPLQQDITHTRSYCPKCNHRLNFLDLIPILSYIFLGGKCRYCKSKIRPRYIIIEITSGLVFLLFTILLKIDILNINYNKIATLIFGMVFLSTIFITAGIFKEYKKVQKGVFNFGIASEIIYMIYLYILNTSIYRYMIYLLLLVLILIINNYQKTNEKIKKVGFIIFILIGIYEIFMIMN